MIKRWRAKAPGTHVLMDGGILVVPHDEIPAFHEAYISDLQSGHQLFVVEQKTEVFKFFVDLDYNAADALTDGEILDICHVLDGVVNSGRCCIARAPPRPVDHLIKSGVHVYWPDVHVTRGDALAIRTRILLRLAGDSRDWAKIIDSSVYTGSGLRMIWSHKKPCGDPYTPWRILGGADFPTEPSAEVLALFSVRTGETARPTRIVIEDTSALEAFIRQYFPGHHDTKIKQLVRHSIDGWYAQSTSKYCERIEGCHKSNHVWFSIYRGAIVQRCFNEECRDWLKGQQHNLSPTVVEQLKHVAVVGRDDMPPFLDVAPTPGSKKRKSTSVQKVRAPSTPLLGPSPRDVGALPRKHPLL
jgi:hypothetical protein